jgi:molybdopterin molybdotransferase
VIPFEKIQEEWLAIHPKDGGVWKSALKGDEQHQHSQTNQHGDAQQKVYRVMAEDIKVKPFLNVHRCGEDFSKGDIVMSAPCRMSSPRLAIGASLGYAKVEVYKIPKISLVTTGSELVDIETVPLPHQIRKSNVHAGAAALEACGFSDLEMMHLPDDEQSTREGLSRCLEHRDVLIISGGVSKGKLDYVPSALEAEGVKKVFHRIAQKPGKPLWFGRKGNKLVFGLPGNPASMLVCLHRYVLPLLWKSQGLETPVLEYFSRDELPVKSKLTMFKTVALGNDGHGSAVSLCKDHGSGDYASLGQGDGFVEIPPRDEPWPKGTVFRYYPWH